MTYGIALGMFLIWVCGVLAGALRGSNDRVMLKNRLEVEVKNNARLNSELNTIRDKISNMQDRLSRFKRTRGKHGRFVSR